ncbi:MAG: hypothetical protein ACREP9_04635 [Candidatus Dormibacteraceae bacterium]
MLEIIRGLRAVQQQIDLLVAQLMSQVPDSGDRVAETCRSLAHTPFCVAEYLSANAYEPLIPGVWLGFAKKAPVQVRQHLRPDTGSENRAYDLEISTGSGFESGWLTLEFLLTRPEIITKDSLSISVEMSSNVAGHLQFAVKAHGREIEPRFSELVKYEIEEGTLHITDIASLGRSVPGISDEFHDVRVLIFLPPLAGATFTFSSLRLALL